MKGASLTEHPLFYTSVVPLDRERHRELRLDWSERRFRFCAGAHLVPAVIDEFVLAAAHLPIVFAPGPARVTPVFLTGLFPGRSAAVTGEGAWSLGYVPAFVRRYPFILGEIDGGEPLLCLDDRSPLLRADGERLFAEDGTETNLLRTQIGLVRDYQDAAKRSEDFVEALGELDLFLPVTLAAKTPEGPEHAVHGLMVVNQSKLDQLPNDTFLKLRGPNFLPALYAHLASLNRLDVLRADTRR